MSNEFASGRLSATFATCVVITLVWFLGSAALVSADSPSHPIADSHERLAESPAIVDDAKNHTSESAGPDNVADRRDVPSDHRLTTRQKQIFVLGIGAKGKN